MSVGQAKVGVQSFEKRAIREGLVMPEPVGVAAGWARQEWEYTA